MSIASKHFEVQAHRSEGWSLEELCNDIDAAIRIASSFVTLPEWNAARVIAVTYDDGTYDVGETEVHFAGDPVTLPSTQDKDECQPVCVSYEELYSADAQRAIGRLLKAPLMQWKITVPELLYSEAYLNKLNDTGTILQGAVQKAAIAQSSKTSGTANERVLELYDLVAASVQAMRKLGEGKIPEILDNDLAVVLSGLEGDPDRQQKLMIAVAKYFSGFDTIADKYDQAFKLLSKYDQPEIAAAMDMYIAGYLDQDVNIVELLGEEKNFGTTLIDFINLCNGTFVGRGSKLERQELLNAKIGADLLPQSRQILLLRLEDGILGHRSFVVGDEYQSMLSHDKIYQALHNSDGSRLGRPELIDALEARCEKMLTRETVGKMLGVLQAPAEKIQKLLDINKGVVGAANKNKLAKFIFHILFPAYSEKLLVSNNTPVMARLKVLRDFQKQVVESGFIADYTEQITRRLDEISMIILKKNLVVKKLLEQHSGRVDKLMALLKLLGADVLTEGEAADAVRAHAKLMLSDEEFFTELLASSSEKAEQVKILKNFQDMLSSAGFAS